MDSKDVDIIPLSIIQFLEKNFIKLCNIVTPCVHCGNAIVAKSYSIEITSFCLFLLKKPKESGQSPVKYLPLRSQFYIGRTLTLNHDKIL